SVLQDVIWAWAPVARTILKVASAATAKRVIISSLSSTFYPSRGAALMRSSGARSWHQFVLLTTQTIPGVRGCYTLKAPLILIGIYCGLGGCDFLASALLFITGGVPLPCDPVDLPFLAKVACGRLAFYSTALKLWDKNEGMVEMCSPTDASSSPSRVPTHGSGPMRIATPSPWWTCTSYSLPVLTGAPKFLNLETRCLLRVESGPSGA